ncbi:NFX1-type zinc finger-containing protein 1-like [Neocloeon triangulifer]|uniref:NFX1-type zinc finger-containing protein 1-like n=1 Tax=Neocloeon triangulifer TaxID=2078957 RepID=UPI00286ECF91|nr:NFX1-type zinc finger-containing protein 1-like [Neocloeon triangulifer]
MFKFPFRSQDRRRSDFPGSSRRHGRSGSANLIMEDTDYKKISVFPTFGELVESKEVKLKPNIIQGPYKSIQQYLDIHFRLFREDFVSPFRKGIQVLVRNSNARFPPSDVRLYKNVKYLDSAHEKYLPFEERCKFCKDDYHLVRFGSLDSRKSGDDLAQSKIFMVGSLVCFTSNNFRTLTFATVKCREKEHLSKSQIVVQFCHSQILDKNSSYMMIESEAFFEPYYQVLTALKEMKEEDFPFPQYIIKVQKEDALPCYLRSRGPVYISVSGLEEDFKFDVLNTSAWPSAAQLGINDSQFRALQAALTKELAVIQGPPGTGKTFMAMKITEILIKNKFIMNRRAPILVVCMTNHALDQFLVGVLKFTKNILRYGGQSKCRELDAYNFQKLEGFYDDRLMQARGREVIGLTTTGAARARSMLKDLNCEIVIVEEAAEILEVHVVASLNKCQHLILIGDHKQLQPKIADHKLTNYKLNISLFERMVINRDKCSTLEVQHRMAPAMTKLIVPLIYKTLKDHESVLRKPKPKSLVNRVSFVTHKFPESQFKNGHSKMNEHEATFLVALCKHLLKQDGYKPDDVTILTTYKGQMFHIKDIISNDESEQALDLSYVRVAVVDDYQGEECNIILLSLVRGNHNGNIGFLANENRVCVALSRAKHGIVIVGDMDTLSSKAQVWKSIKDSLQEQRALDTSLTLRCEAHPQCIFRVQNAADFQRLAPFGGCNENNCFVLMDCGHICKAKCHTSSTEHNICTEPCKKTCRREHHICSRRCFEMCERQCTSLVIATRPCGHSLWKLCYRGIYDSLCKAVCNKKLSCGHNCKKMCHKACSPCELCHVDSLNFDSIGI